MKKKKGIELRENNAFDNMCVIAHLSLLFIEIWLLDLTLYPLDDVSDDIKSKLIAKGIPESEIAYIHDAKNEKQKSELFEKVRSDEIRVLLGSANCAHYEQIIIPVL